MGKEARSSDELKQLSERLLHDVEVFFGVSRSLTKYELGFSPAPEPYVHTAQVESFAMHARQLVDFIYGKATAYADDAFAHHYFESREEWESLVGPQGLWVGRVKFPRIGDRPRVDQFGEEVAHLNYKQDPAAVYARSWPVMQIASELGEDLNTFAANAPASICVRSFRRRMQEQIPLVSRLPRHQRGLAAWTSPASLRRIA